MPFDVDSARKQGVTDDQIINFLSEKHNFDLEKARQAGASNQQIIEFLSPIQASIPISESPIESLREIGEAPEMNELSLRSAKLGAAANFMMNPSEFAEVLKKEIPGAEILTGSEGNLRAKLPSGEFAINKPGISGQDLAQFATRALIYSRLPMRGGANLGTLSRIAAESAGLETGLQAAEKGLGGEFNILDPALSAGGGVVGQLGGNLFLRGLSRVITNRTANNIIRESAPTRDTLRTAARDIYDQVDNIGVRVRPEPYERMIQNLHQTLTRSGLDNDLTPKAAALLRSLREEPLENLSVGRLETLRVKANNLRIDNNRAEANLGREAVNVMDEFIENISDHIVNVGSRTVNGQPVASALREARNLWGRYRRSQIVQDTIELALTRRSGTDLGLRNEFANLHRKIIRGSVKGFTREERAAISQVANGTFARNTATQLGRLGIPLDQATNSLMIGLMGGSFYFGGVPVGTAVAAVGVPTILRHIGSRATRTSADLAEAIVRSSGNGPAMVRAYLRATPRSQRSAADLAGILFNNGIRNMRNTGNSLVDNAIWMLKNTGSIEAQKMDTSKTEESILNMMMRHGTDN